MSEIVARGQVRGHQGFGDKDEMLLDIEVLVPRPDTLDAERIWSTWGGSARVKAPRAVVQAAYPIDSPVDIIIRPRTASE